MHETTFVHLPPCPHPVTKGLGIIAGIATISLASAWAFELYRKRELVRILASMPGASNILPGLRAHSEMVLKQFGVGIPPKSENPQP